MGNKWLLLVEEQVAFQKLKTLEGTNTKVTIISPSIISEIEEWLLQHDSKWYCKHYEPC